MSVSFEEILPEQSNYTQHESSLVAASGVIRERYTSKQVQLVEHTKQLIIDLLNDFTNYPGSKYSQYISEKTGYDYTYLSTLFSAITSGTIQQFIIDQKITIIKKLIAENTLSIKEISFKLNYSSLAHLSNQFKRVTGYSPSYFRRKLYDPLLTL